MSPDTATAADTTAPPLPGRRVFGLRITPLTERRSLWIFVLLFVLSLGAELIANDKPFLVYFNGGFYVPVAEAYAETTFGGEFATEADYRDPYVKDLINAKGWMIWPPIPYSYDTIIKDLPGPAPSPPSLDNWLGTDD